MNGIKIGTIDGSVKKRFNPTNFSAVTLELAVECPAILAALGHTINFAGPSDEIIICNRALLAEETKAVGAEENNGESLPPPKPSPFRKQSACSMVQSPCFNQFFASAFGERRPRRREVFADFDPFKRLALPRTGFFSPSGHARDAFFE